MLTGEPPWKGATTIVQLYMTISSVNGPPPIDKEIPNDLENFLQTIFKLEPKQRPNALELQNHFFLA